MLLKFYGPGMCWNHPGIPMNIGNIFMQCLQPSTFHHSWQVNSVFGGPKFRAGGPKFCTGSLTCTSSKFCLVHLVTMSAMPPVDNYISIYIFMPPPLDIMLSGCPSVRPKPEIPSFDLYMGPLVHPINRNRFTACPSVRPSREVSGHLPENAWPEILHADVSWPSSELISLWPWSVDFCNFGTILT